MSCTSQGFTFFVFNATDFAMQAKGGKPVDIKHGLRNKFDVPKKRNYLERKAEKMMADKVKTSTTSQSLSSISKPRYMHVKCNF